DPGRRRRPLAHLRVARADGARRRARREVPRRHVGDL
ncbi:MAG: hypothetical protein AVDCRST_MAG30-1548, partial [uncultured Solirubrobacteraceae bacterium]